MAGRVFLPGHEPGCCATGFMGNAESHQRYIDRLKREGYPVGDDVASFFPWMRYTRMGILSGQKIQVRRDENPNSFVNQTPNPILVYEVRLYIGDQPDSRGGSGLTEAFGNANPHPVGVIPAGWTDLQKAIWAKMSIPDRRDITQKWLPMFQYQTEPDHLLRAALDRYAWELPCPYFVSRHGTFSVDIGMNEALVPADSGEDPFYLTLHGFGTDGEPLDLCKAAPEILAADVGREYLSISFDDDRDIPMRDGWITHIGIGAGSVNNAEWYLQHAQIRVNAPEGPNWHSGEFFPVSVLARQMSSYYLSLVAPYNIFASMMHRPATPYILFPGEEFVIELWNRTDTIGTYDSSDIADADMHVDVAIHGIQGVF